LLIDNERLSELCEDIENEIGQVETMEELKEARKAYFKEHRYIVAYFLYLQEEIEKEDDGSNNRT
jgi:hypothetical protein